MPDSAKESQKTHLAKIRPHGLGPLPAEAVRKGDVQEPMGERPGSALEFADGLDFHRERTQSPFENRYW